WEEKMMTGLKTYKEKNRDVFILMSFTVPFDDASWPQELRGYSLGKAVARLRSNLCKDLVLGYVCIGSNTGPVQI
ncbi:hypothetical protein PHMEG_00035390, partial [Phytophthora megakarya]